MSKKYKNTVKQNKKRQIKKYLDFIEYCFNELNVTTQIFLSTCGIYLDEDNENVLKWPVLENNKEYIESVKRITNGQLEYINTIGISKELGYEMVKVGLIKPMSQFSWHKDLPSWIPTHKLKPKQLKKVLIKWKKNVYNLPEPVVPVKYVEIPNPINKTYYESSWS